MDTTLGDHIGWFLMLQTVLFMPSVLLAIFIYVISYSLTFRVKNNKERGKKSSVVTIIMTPILVMVGINVFFGYSDESIGSEMAYGLLSGVLWGAAVSLLLSMPWSEILKNR